MPEAKVIMGRDMENHARWEKENLRQITLKLNKVTDKDVLDHIEKQPNKRDYLIKLIRKDMSENSENQ